MVVDSYNRGAFQPITSTGMLTRAGRKLGDDSMGRSLIVNTTNSAPFSPQGASTAPEHIPTLTDRDCCTLGLYGWVSTSALSRCRLIFQVTCSRILQRLSKQLPQTYMEMAGVTAGFHMEPYVIPNHEKRRSIGAEKMAVGRDASELGAPVHRP